ncbi:very-long-chain enoyl-CoA reductase [Elysia marginata]|uniref:Very-long-chain enoyl-CoA reductase n=1 Tax=Elysia marginata TaxID=1093978 RepID=A0AAV4EKR7_9GAST|nr:very-long-chain enoyl-CoA reductase [Elysia marginata]
MSAAFDTINREVLIKILEEIVKEDELRRIRFLLSSTQMNTRLNKADTKVPFTSNISTPQGDGLSSVMLIFYYEYALESVRKIIGELKTPTDNIIPREITYADDVSFTGPEHIDIHQITKKD